MLAHLERLRHRADLNHGAGGASRRQGARPAAEHANRPGLGVWSAKEMRVRTAPRRQPDPVHVTSKEECQAATRCYLEWTVDSNGGAIIREYVIRWRRVSF